MTNDLDRDYDDLVMLRKKEQLLARAIEYIKQYIAGHDLYDYPAGRELVSKFDELEKGG